MYIYCTAIYPHNAVLQIIHQFTIFCWTVMSLYYTAFMLVSAVYNFVDPGDY